MINKKHKKRLYYLTNTIMLVFLVIIYGVFFGKVNKQKEKVIQSEETVKSIDNFETEIKKYASYQDNLLLAYYDNYLLSQKINPNYSYIKTLNKVNHPNFLNSYDDDKTYLNIDDIILVNRIYKFNNLYIPNDLVKITDVNYVIRKDIYNNEKNIYLKKEVYDALQALNKEVSKLDLSILVYSGYRTYNEQFALLKDEIFTERVRYIALPGHSEHQSGLAVDIATVESGLTIHFENTKEFHFLKNNAHKYGFILRYPKDKTQITGYGYEPWHYRYVGSIASDIYESGLTLEEYIYYNYEII